MSPFSGRRRRGHSAAQRRSRSRSRSRPRSANRQPLPCVGFSGTITRSVARLATACEMTSAHERRRLRKDVGVILGSALDQHQASACVANLVMSVHGAGSRYPTSTAGLAPFCRILARHHLPQPSSLGCHEARCRPRDVRSLRPRPLSFDQAFDTCSGTSPPGVGRDTASGREARPLPRGEGRKTVARRWKCMLSTKCGRASGGIAGRERRCGEVGEIRSFRRQTPGVGRRRLWRPEPLVCKGCTRVRVFASRWWYALELDAPDEPGRRTRVHPQLAVRRAGLSQPTRSAPTKRAFSSFASPGFANRAGSSASLGSTRGARDRPPSGDAPILSAMTVVLGERQGELRRASRRRLKYT